MRKHILAIETSTDAGSVAVQIEDGEQTQVWVRDLDPSTPASNTLLPVIVELVAEAGISLADIDLFVYGDGPGAFTGLRLACATAQALALPGNSKVMGVCTLAAVALASGHERVWVQLDARMGEWYAGAYDLSSGLIELVSPEVASLAQLTTPAMPCQTVSDKPHARGLLLAMPYYTEQSAAEAGLRYVRNKVALTEAERGVNA